MNYKNIITILVLLLTTINVNGQTTDNLIKAKYRTVSEAYGYISGQEASLNFIKKLFPHLEINILKADLAFNLTFGKAKPGMKNYLIGFFGQSEFIDFENKLTSEIDKMIGQQVYTEDTALSFISEVESRAKGNIASPVLETLLSFQYADKPEEEFTSGFTHNFKTKGHPKSKNTDWQIKVPKSWKAAEGERPNIIQKFTSDYGSGSQIIMLMVNDLELPKGYKLSKAELNDFFTEEQMKNIVPENGQFISFKKMTIDNHIGGMIEIEQIVERLDTKMKMRMVQFMFIRDNKMYTLQSLVGSEELDADLSVSMKKYMTLFKLVANSIVVNEQY
jgi:hypothetical protein